MHYLTIGAGVDVAIGDAVEVVPGVGLIIGSTVGVDTGVGIDVVTGVGDGGGGVKEKIASS